ncbi:MAG TPA: proteasome accessory factor PafA2 family protein [Candidatus Binatia bacterium]|jgi:proteasome accessory factor A
MRSASTIRPDSLPPLAPTVCGADVELANFIVGADSVTDRSREAARRVLAHVIGVAPGRFAAIGHDFGDTGRDAWEQVAAERTRVWLATNGGCIYIDMDHVELCLPEVSSAFDHVAAWHAMIRIARDAAERASEGLPDGEFVELVANNSDGQSSSYGGHLDFLVRRRTWDEISRRAGSLLFLASHHASSIVYTGAGKVGAENGRPRVTYQLSQRADYMESLFGYQTTEARPLVNTRDEPLCGYRLDSRNPDSLARMHVIHCDTGLCHGAQVLRVGVEQIVLAMLGAEHVDRSLLLEDPVDAIVAWSHDIKLGRRATLVSGEEVTAVELQRRYFDVAVEAHARGAFPEIPRVDEILSLWDDTLSKLAGGDLAALAPRLDWVLKLDAIRSLPAMRDREERAEAAKHADLQYAAVDPDRGLYWAYEDAGLVELHASDEAIARSVVEPPADTRAFARALVLRTFGDEVRDVNWDYVRIRPADGGPDFELALDDPRDPAFSRPLERDATPAEEASTETNFQDRSLQKPTTRPEEPQWNNVNDRFPKSRRPLSPP